MILQRRAKIKRKDKKTRRRAEEGIAMTWWAWMLAGIGALSIFLLLVTLPFFLVLAVQVFKAEKTHEKTPQDEPVEDESPFGNKFRR